MVSIRFHVYVHSIIFMLLQFVVLSLQDSKNMVVTTRDKNVKEGALFSQQVKGTLNVDPDQVEVLAKGKIFAGRKLTKIVNIEPTNREEMTSKIAYASLKRANPRNDNDKVPKRTKKIYHNDHDQDVEVKMSSTFMALNADYHVPRSHPPRNN